MVIDASDLLLGRLSSIVATHLLRGQSVSIVNCGQAVVSGSRKTILTSAQNRLHTRTLGAQNKAPKHPRRPEGILRRTIRGMLPIDKPSGKTAYRRLKVYLDFPAALKVNQIVVLSKAKAQKKSTVLTLNEIAKNIGWNGSTEE